jgi:hypothetical protein
MREPLPDPAAHPREFVRAASVRVEHVLCVAIADRHVVLDQLVVVQARLGRDAEVILTQPLPVGVVVDALAPSQGCLRWSRDECRLPEQDPGNRHCVSCCRTW